MGCIKSRVGPMSKECHTSGKRSGLLKSEDSRTDGIRVWRRMIHFRTVKVTPAKSHLGGGDNPEYADKVTVGVRPASRLESFLYSSNKPQDGPSRGAADNTRRPGNMHPTLSKAQRSQIQTDILRDLRATGILDGHTSASGAISFTVADPAGSGITRQSLRRPPERLARLDKSPSATDPKKAERLMKKLEAAEKRRKTKLDATKERLRAHSRLGMQHSEVAAQAERALQQRVADKIIEKELAFNRRVDELNQARRERARVMSRKGDHAKQVVETLDKECQMRAAESLAKKQKVLLTNLQRQERLRTNRSRLNQKHGENVRQAVARRLAEQEERAEMEMSYEIETANESGDEGGFEPESQWIM